MITIKELILAIEEELEENTFDDFDSEFHEGYREALLMVVSTIRESGMN